MRLGSICPVCNSKQIKQVVQVSQVPVYCNLVWPSSDKAKKAEQADIQLSCCVSCGHVYNNGFDETLMDYTQEYENALHFSQHFQDHANTLTAHLVEQYNLKGKNIIDIGCGDGNFLKQICATGNNFGIGFDPSRRQNEKEVKEGNITFIKDFYSEKYSRFKADLVCCRHVLEHIPDPVDFLQRLGNVMEDCQGTSFYFEVPNGSWMINDLGIWDLIYEHCHYFTEASLEKLFSIVGFVVTGISESYHGQFLCVEGQFNKRQHDAECAVGKAVHSDNISEFARQFEEKVSFWQEKLSQYQEAGKKIVAWGAGSKGVTFLNSADQRGSIQYIVDLNPHKQGKYIACSSQEIIFPQALIDYQPDVIIVMNPVYRDEIQQMMSELSVVCAIETV